MTMGKFISFLLISGILFFSILSGPGCANIVPPSGGLRDSLPPVPVRATPKDSALNAKEQKITITFNEYIELKNVNEKVLISPYPAKDPVYESKLRTLTVRLKDSLLPNTTYSIDFGDAIVDLNEGNPLKNFRYTFSTGSVIDSNELSGRVVLAETGKTDSTMFAVLYTKQEDSTVAKEKPKYVARVDGKGNFRFTNLPEGTFYVYALKEEDGDKKYSQPTEQFAFLDSPVVVNANTKPVKLFSFAAEKLKSRDNNSGTGVKGDKPKTLLSANNLEAGAQDFLDSFKLSYQKPIRHFDSSKIILFIDSSKQVTDLLIKNDSLNKQLVLYTAWKEGGTYKLFLNKDYATDTSGLSATKNDTISFRVKTEKEYGSVRITFKNLDTALHPVLIFYTSDQVFARFPVKDLKWYRKLFKPGIYQLGILYDTNENGVWDAGNFFAKQKRQPEIVQQLVNTITVKENWDNELVIDLNSQQVPDKNQKPAGPAGRNF